jgi:predicted PurR-regulated permease PerM
VVTAPEGGEQQRAEPDDGDHGDEGEPAPPDVLAMTPRAGRPPRGRTGRHRRDRTGTPVSHQPIAVRRANAGAVAVGAPVDGSAVRGLAQPAGCTIEPVTAQAGPPRIQIPRWVQLVGLPLLVFFAWVIAQAAGHTIFLFLVATLIALLLDPIVLTLEAVRVRRGFAVALVYITFAAILIAILIALGTVVVTQTKTAAGRVNNYFTATNGQTNLTPADHDVNRLQQWLDHHHLASIRIEKSGHSLVQRIRKRDVGRYTHRIVNFVEGAAVSIGRAVFDCVLILVVSIYMLLDMKRLARGVDRRFPPNNGRPLISRMEHALVSYVRGQITLSLIIGATAGLGLWILGVTGLLPGADTYALLFGAWVGITEVLPYLGPWLGAIPPVIYALVVHPFSVLWVVLLFLGIHQIEGHVVVPKVMGSALRLHPLLVIFGLLAGANVDGLIGALIALPILAVGKAAWEFFAERITFESWSPGSAVPVEVEPVEPPRAERIARR